MTKYKLLTLFLTAPLAAFAGSAGRAPELPSLGELKGRLSEISVPEAAASRVATADAGTACVMPEIDGTTIGRGLFQSDYRIKRGDNEIGKVSKEGIVYSFKDNDGTTIGKASITDERDASFASIEGCSGKVAVIRMEYGPSASVFTVLSADGKSVIGTTGRVPGRSFTLTSPSGAILAVVEGVNWVTAYRIAMSPGTEANIVIFTAIMNNVSVQRRSQEQRRERERERGGRSGATASRRPRR